MRLLLLSFSTYIDYIVHICCDDVVIENSLSNIIFIHLLMFKQHHCAKFLSTLRSLVRKTVSVVHFCDFIWIQLFGSSKNVLIRHVKFLIRASFIEYHQKFSSGTKFMSFDSKYSTLEPKNLYFYIKYSNFAIWCIWIQRHSTDCKLISENVWISIFFARISNRPKCITVHTNMADFRSIFVCTQPLDLYHAIKIFFVFFEYVFGAIFFIFLVQKLIILVSRVPKFVNFMQNC